MNLKSKNVGLSVVTYSFGTVEAAAPLIICSPLRIRNVPKKHPKACTKLKEIRAKFPTCTSSRNGAFFHDSVMLGQRRVPLCCRIPGSLYTKQQISTVCPPQLVPTQTVRDPIRRQPTGTRARRIDSISLVCRMQNGNLSKIIDRWRQRTEGYMFLLDACIMPQTKCKPSGEILCCQDHQDQLGSKEIRCTHICQYCQISICLVELIK